jgi:hypothetical protein
MSFTPTNNNFGQGSMPDISAKMIQSGSVGNYESQGVDRAVIIGQNGIPIGKVDYAPPYDLLTEENRARVENARRAKEAKRLQLERERNAKNNPKPKVIPPTDVITSVQKDLIGKSFQYITEGKFGEEVSVVSCQMNNDEIELTMSDDTTIFLNDIESKFLPLNIKNVEIITTIDEAEQSADIIKKEETINKRYNIVETKTESKLPISPLQELLRTRKKNLTPISVDLTIDLVKKDFFKIIDDSYDNALDYVVEHIMNGLTLEDVKNAVKNQLDLYYKSDSRSLTNDDFEKKVIYKEPETIILEKTEQ